MHQTSRRQEKRDAYAEVFDNLILKKKVWMPKGMVPDFLSCLGHLYKLYYYSFKIFLRFWLAKITRIIHQNQLLLTKFGRISPYWTDDVKSAAKLQIIEPLTKKTWGQVWVVFEVSNGRTFYSFHSELWSNKHGKNSKKRTRQMTSDIWSIFADLDSPLSPKLPAKDALSIWT